MISVSESVGLTKFSRKTYIDVNQRSLFDEGIPESGRRTDNVPATDEILHGREISGFRGNVVSRYRPEYGTLPEISSKPIGTWRSSRSKITTPEDAAVIARDNIGENADENLVSIVTDENGKVFTVNQHSIE